MTETYLRNELTSNRESSIEVFVAKAQSGAPEDFKRLFTEFKPKMDRLAAYFFSQLDVIGDRSVTLEDLKQELYIHFSSKLVPRFDASSGTSFISFFEQQSRWFLQRAVGNLRVGKHENNLNLNYIEIATDVCNPASGLCQDLDVLTETVNQCRARLGKKPFTPVIVARAFRYAAEKEKIQSMRDADLENILIDQSPNPEILCMRQEAIEFLRRHLFELSPRELEVLARHYGFDNLNEESLAKIGKSWKTTRQTASNMAIRARKKVRSSLEARGINPDTIHLVSARRSKQKETAVA